MKPGNLRQKTENRRGEDNFGKNMINLKDIEMKTVNEVLKIIYGDEIQNKAREYM